MIPPLFGVILLSAQIVLFISEYVTVCSNYISSVSTRHGGGLGMCNWFIVSLEGANPRDDPGMFDRALSKVKRAKKIMGKPGNHLREETS